MTYPHASWYIDQAISLIAEMGDPEEDSIAHCFLCAHDHHHSVTFVELVARRIRRPFPACDVRCVHHDLTEQHLQRYHRISQIDFEDLLEGPDVSAIRHPPPRLLHEL